MADEDIEAKVKREKKIDNYIVIAVAFAFLGPPYLLGIEEARIKWAFLPYIAGMLLLASITTIIRRHSLLADPPVSGGWRDPKLLRAVWAVITTLACLATAVIVLVPVAPPAG